jgi:hypothetical protein
MSEPKLEAFRSMIAAGRSATEHELLSVVGDMARFSVVAATELERLAVAADMVSGATAVGSSTPSVLTEDLKRWVCGDMPAGNTWEGPAAWLETARTVLGQDLGPSCLPALIDVAEQLISESETQRYGANL